MTFISPVLSVRQDMYCIRECSKREAADCDILDGIKKPVSHLSILAVIVKGMFCLSLVSIATGIIQENFNS